jgi:uncharacterized membrane protein YedE/YeeE
MFPTEDIEMFARKGSFSRFGRAAVMATVAAMALTAVEPTMAQAAGRRHYHGGGGGAAAAAFAGIVGTGLAIAATQNRRDYYDSYGSYGGGPAYYDGGPAYYGGGPYYGGYRSGVPHFNGHPLAGW